MAYLDSNEPYQRIDGVGFMIGGTIGAGIVGGFHYGSNRQLAKLPELQEQARQQMRNVDMKTYKRIKKLGEETNALVRGQIQADGYRMMNNQEPAANMRNVNTQYIMDNSPEINRILQRHGNTVNEIQDRAEKQKAEIRRKADRPLSRKIHEIGFSSKGRIGAAYAAGILGLGLIGGLLGNDDGL